jgi:DNA-binding transcriptional LysR family regulator
MARSNDTFLLSLFRPATIGVVRRNRTNRQFSASCQNASYRAARILEIGLVLPPDHRLADQSEIRFERLRNECWILPPREANPVLYDELISCCHKAGFTPDVIAEMTQRPRVVSQVACGIGIATLVQTMTHLCIGGTTFHRLIQPTPMLDCYLVYRKSPSSPLLKSFISTYALRNKSASRDSHSEIIVNNN